MNNQFNPTRPLIRFAFAVAAAAATFTTSASIDGLAHKYSAAGQLAKAQPVMMASAQR